MTSAADEGGAANVWKRNRLPQKKISMRPMARASRCAGPRHLATKEDHLPAAPDSRTASVVRC
jgi:hypothetical protein